MPHDRPLRVASNEDHGASHFLLRLTAPPGEPAAESSWAPGQFAMITLGQAEGATDPLLRRPFSLFNPPGTPPGTLEIFYKVLGRGTAQLSRLRAGESLRALWPLGNGFAPGRPAGSRLLLVAGGIGAASLHPLAVRESAAGRAPLVLYGCRTAAEQAGILPTQQAGVECLVSTDDGTAGQKGYVSEMLDRFLAREGASAAARWVVCACGPTPMMRATAEVAARHGVACHLSLESPMACGFGVCVGCVVGTRSAPGAPVHYRRICVEGPVFDAREICW